MTSRWNPDLYLKFQRERTQPSVDLVSRIELDRPGAILDVGCGPGNSTQVLRQRWPDARVVGLDSSLEMIQAAGKAHPDGEWLHADIRELPADPRYDLVFSNAAIQWIPDHAALLPRMFAMVSPGGALAVQIPLYREMPINEVVATVASRDEWRERMEGCDARFTFHRMERYYDILCEPAREIAMWQTWYAHEMESHEMIIEMVRSTGLKEFLARLETDAEKDRFICQVLEGTRKAYPARINGRVLFPFKRLFFVAYR